MKKIAIWVITQNGVDSALKIADNISNIHIYSTKRVADFFKSKNIYVDVFDKISNKIKIVFNRYEAHIFIMSTGIVVRLIAPYIVSKTVDPAVIVLDDKAFHCISLLSGHIGGANEFTKKISSLTGAVPVISTATDLNNVPAIDVIAKKANFFIENPKNIKKINMAFLEKNIITIEDKYFLIRDKFNNTNYFDSNIQYVDDLFLYSDIPSVYISDIIFDKNINLPDETLILRPPIIAVGIGCNRNTSKEEIQKFFFKTLKKFALSEKSVFALASIDLKNDEKGLLEFAKEQNIKIEFFGKCELNKVENIKTPSDMAKKYTGARSVCEAAAILMTSKGNLIVSKQISGNVTLAIARKKIYYT